MGGAYSMMEEMRNALKILVKNLKRSLGIHKHR
jgi:hypothetical protein